MNQVFVDNYESIYIYINISKYNIKLGGIILIINKDKHHYIVIQPQSFI